jgi:1-deoxy-D-xylulose-5-phosphate synthase
MAPSDENECRHLLTTAFRHDGPAAVRYPRGTGTGAPVERALEPLPFGQGIVRRESTARPGARVAILAFGTMVPPALAAAEAIDATVADMRFVKPIDRALIERLAHSHEALVTVEENVVMGGAGSACREVLDELDLARPILHLGLPDAFVDHGDPARLLASVGLDATGIEASIRDRFGALLRETRRVKSVA